MKVDKEMSEIKSNLIEYRSGYLLSINLSRVQTISYKNDKDNELYIVSFGGTDYYNLPKSYITESSWNLLNIMLVNL